MTNGTNTQAIEVIGMSEEENKTGSLTEELKREIKKGAKLDHAQRLNVKKWIFLRRKPSWKSLELKAN